VQVEVTTIVEAVVDKTTHHVHHQDLRSTAHQVTCLLILLLVVVQKLPSFFLCRISRPTVDLEAVGSQRV
jgi:hypothetical protein